MQLFVVGWQKNPIEKNQTNLVNIWFYKFNFLKTFWKRICVSLKAVDVPDFLFTANIPMLIVMKTIDHRMLIDL